MTSKISDLKLTQNEIQTIYLRCIENVRSLLKIAKLLSGQGSGQYALGLYMYAVEEFGKAHLLKAESNLHTIPNWIFGRKIAEPKSAHDAKLAEGFKNLPEVCQILNAGLRFIQNDSDIIQTYFLGKNSKLSIPAFTSGFFTDATRDSKIEFDFKTACFHIDWDNENRRPSFPIAVDEEKLNNNIELFEKTIE